MNALIPILISSTPNALPLEDIIEPEQISQLPIAVGWWLLLCLVVTVMTALTIFVFHSRRKNQAKRAFQKELSLIQTNDPQASVQIAQLLKQLALSYFPRQKVAGLHGSTWVAFLNQSMKQPQFQESWFSQLYNPKSTLTPEQVDTMKQAAMAYCKQLKVIGGSHA